MPRDFEEQLEQLLHRYADPIRPTRDTFAEIKERLRVPFDLDSDLDGDDDVAEEFAFTLEDTLEGTLEEPMEDDQVNQRPSTTVRLSRWGDRKRALSPRATAIAGIAAALILAVVATTIYTQFAARRTAHPAATATIFTQLAARRTTPPSATAKSGAFTKIAVPNMNLPNYPGFTTAPDGSFWYSGSFPYDPTIGHVTPDGTNTEFLLPTDDTVTRVDFSAMAVGSDGNIWFTESDEKGSTFTSYLKRMTPNGVLTTIPVPATLGIGIMIAGPDGSIWFGGRETLVPPASGVPGTYKHLIGRITMDGHITEVATPSQGEYIFWDSCRSPDGAMWYTRLDNSIDSSTLGHIGHVSPSGQLREFTVSYVALSVACGADGALWYGESVPNTGGRLEGRNGHIGHITPDGVASDVPIDPSADLNSFTAGSDGAIWCGVLQDQTGAFGRISPSGKMKKFSTGGNTQISVIASAPGALWLSDMEHTLWYYRLPA